MKAEEKWIGKEVKIVGDNYGYLNYFRLIIESIDDKLDFPIAVKVGDTDSYEWFQEKELKLV
jgi:hypothetical protein